MITRINLATDIATIGIWDAATAPDHVGKLGHRKYRTIIEQRARESELFFVDMHSDGAYEAAIYVDEEPNAEWLSKHYRQIPKIFRIRSKSGILIAGGLEDYTNPRPQITSDDSRCALRAGLYRIDVFLDKNSEEEMMEQISAIVSPEELAHYESRPTGCGLSALVMLIAGGLFIWSGIIPLLTGLALSLMIVIRSHRKASRDPRVQRVQKEIDRWNEDHPTFILIFKPDDSGTGSDGFFSYEEFAWPSTGNDPQER